MSEYDGCIVCGVVLNPDEGLRCHDCVTDEAMVHTGTKARLIRLTDEGPVEVGPADVAAALADEYGWAKGSPSAERVFERLASP